MPIHAEDLRRFLSETTGRPINLRINDNTHSVINTTRDGIGPGLRVSVHRIFLDADDRVIKALAGFITGATPAQQRIIRTYINENNDRIGATESVRPPRVIKGTAKGKIYNLREQAAALNELHFNNELKFRIIWGKAVRAGKRQRHVTLGTWNDRQGIIRIHPMLDHEGVPEYFLDYIVFHEMTHIAVPMKITCGGRRDIHSREFYAVERTFPDYDLAVAWEKRHLPRLIRAWNGGAEFKIPVAAKKNVVPDESDSTSNIAQKISDFFGGKFPV